jgi:hypothetical protein
VRRLLFSFVLLGVVLALPTAAFATLLPPRSHQVTGTVASKSAYSFSVQKAGTATPVINALTLAADNITAKDYPYVWGGGHGVVGIASSGISGPGYNGTRRGYDCSGSVAAVLAAAGLWPGGSGVPNDAGVIQYLRQRGEIAPGAGSGPQEVTLYDDPDVHIFMNINGRFFGTSDGGGGGDRRGGPGWLNDGAWDAHNPRFRRYHIVPRVLRTTTSAGYTDFFQFGPDISVSALPVGARATVTYKTTNQGTMVAQAITLIGETTATGIIQSIAADGSGFTVTTASGRTRTFPAPTDGTLMRSVLDGQVAVGDTVSVTYISKPSLTVISVTVIGAPTQTTTTTTPTTTTPTTTTTTPTNTPTTTTPTTTTPTTSTTTGGSSLGNGGGSGGGGTGGQGF